MGRSTTFKLISLILIPVYLTGCMTVMGRQSDDTDVFFDSNIEGAEIICSGKRTRTPGSIPLKKSKDHSCSAEAEGYEKKIFKVKSGTSGGGFAASTATNAAAWGWWTLGIGLALGWVVDVVSGSMKDLKEDNFYLELYPSKTVPASVGMSTQTIPLSESAVSPAPVKTTPATPQGMAFRIGENPNPPKDARDAR